MTAHPAEVVISTKLFLPTPHHPPVSRARLYQRLDPALEVPLTVVVAPAGWGKSTLVAEWLRRRNRGAGWVSLDRADDDPHRFWRYLLLAAGHAAAPTGAGLGTEALRRLDAAGSTVLRDVVPTFVNELTASPGDVVIVLDDYHVLSNPEIHESVQTVLDRSPPQLHLVLVTRSDPPLPLSRFRVRGSLVELRGEQLRFTVAEASEFLNGGLGLKLSDPDVDRLVSLTEGWAAGLQLAALRLGDRGDPSEFIERFTGADRHVVDYLGEEVLARQPVRLREFLVRTSVLERLSAPLCDAVIETQDSAELLDEIYHANLFLTPLDDERRWLRYHPLFRDILRQELVRTAGRQPASMRPEALHRRAARWYAAAGDDVAAVGHAIESGETGLASELMAGAWRRRFNAGQWQTVRAWLDALPPEHVASHVQLSVARVWLAMDSGRLDEAAAALAATQQAGPADPHLQVLGALHAYKTGDLTGATHRLTEVDAVSDPFVATVFRLLTGVTALWRGDADRADELLSEGARLAEADANRLGYIYAQGCRALLAAIRGYVKTANDLLRDAEAAVEASLSDAHFVATFPALARARLAASRDDWAAARPAAMASVELARRGAGRVEVAAALLTAATIHRHPTLASGDGAEPAALIKQARAVLRRCRDPGPVVNAWLASEQRLAAPRHGDMEPLTDRELAILRLLPGPMSQRELATALFVTPNTLKTHLRAIYRKLQVESRGEAVIRAREHALI